MAEFTMPLAHQQPELFIGCRPDVELVPAAL